MAGTFFEMRTLGIVGGLGPESSIDYYRSIIELYRARNNDGSYPEFVINSVDFKKGLGFVQRNEVENLVRMIAEAIEKLARAGADFGLISANTPHLAFDQISARSAIPLISIVEATCSEVKLRGLKRVALLGTNFTMTGDFYRKVFLREGIELVVPDSNDREYIHDKYLNELVPGIFLPETRAGLLKIIDRMKSKSDIDAVILAGTELPLILREPAHNNLPFLDTTKIHCQAAVNEMLS